MSNGLNRADLGFVIKTKDGFCHWNVKSTGDYSDDCDLGVEYARRFIPCLQTDLGSAMLAWIVLDMQKTDDTSRGVMVGFMNTVAHAAGCAITYLAQFKSSGPDTAAEWRSFADAIATACSSRRAGDVPAGPAIH